MKRIIATAAVLAIALSGAAGAASAQPGHNNDRHEQGRYDNHSGRDDHRGDHQRQQHNWRQGGRIDRNDWSRGSRIDYRSHHLRAPARGYEWREVDGNYVLAAVATGLIASILSAN